MENWRGLFRERFVIEENTEEKYLRKYDHRTIVEELEHFIEQELDKAREEGYEKGKDYQASLDRTCYGTSFEKLEKGIIEDKSPLAPEKGIDWSSPMSPMRR